MKIEVQSFTDELAQSLKRVDTAMQAVANSGVKQETLVILLKAQLGNQVKTDDIRLVLNGLNRLKTNYIKEKQQW